jgi:DeoR family fructose operon transcriptional repressor
MSNSMKSLATERQDAEHSIIRDMRVVRVEDLCERIHASPATVRRDLTDLENRGLIRRVHGGAVSVESQLDEPLFDDKTSISVKEKRSIAEAAAALINDGDTIFLDGGSTLLELTRLLKSRQDLTVVTNSLRAAVELSGLGPNLIMTGGHLRRRSQTMVGGLSQTVLNELYVDKAFMGTIGITVEEGLTTTNGDEAFTKKLAMSRAKEVILLADSSKIGKVAFANTGQVTEIDRLITDKHAPTKFADKMKDKGITVTIV